MSKTMEMKRFTVSLEPRAYDTLRKIAEPQRPPLSLQYVVRYALEEFLDRHAGRRLTLKLKRENSGVNKARGTTGHRNAADGEDCRAALRLAGGTPP